MPDSRLEQLFARFAAARWRVNAGYTVFALAAFVFWLYVTFPYQAVRDRVSAEAGAVGWSVHIGSLGPGLLGVTAKDIVLRPIATGAPVEQVPGAPVKPPLTVTIPSASARPALFPPGLAARADAFGGTVSASVGLLGDLKVNATADKLDAADPMLKATTGIDGGGTLDADLSLSIPREERGPGFDLSKASGAVSLTGNKLLVKGGNMLVPIYGQMTPMDLPRVALGDLDGKIKFEKGAGKIDKLQAKSEDLQLQLAGTVNLGKRFDLSELNLQLKVKTEPELNKRLGLVASALSVLPPDQADPTFRATTITGFLQQPRFGGFSR